LWCYRLHWADSNRLLCMVMKIQVP
jgi:hypothetical protein